MKKPRTMSKWDLPNRIEKRDGYNITEVPDNSPENIAFLIEEHNELVEFVVDLAEHLGVKWDEEL